jgi:hypothetical protein
MIMRSRYPPRKQIKTNYEAQFSTDPILNDKIERKSQLKKITQINSC